MSSPDVERAYVSAMCDIAADRLDETRAAMRSELDELRAEWASSFAAENERVAEQMQRAQADRRAWLESLYDNDHQGDDHELARERQLSGASPARPAPASGGAVSPGQPDPHAAKLAGLTPQDIANMPMTEYAARRAELGVQSPTSMGRLFG
jgi:hypothetical protein